MRNLNNLLEPGILGDYTQCAVIEIFGIKDRKIFNIYTICTLEESKFVEEENEYVTSKLCSFWKYKDIKWGIIKRTLSMQTLKKSLSEINQEHCVVWGNGEKLSLEGLELIEQQYIKGEEDRRSPLNSIIKNNFSQGSYIVEFFDTHKDNFQFIFEDPVILNKFSEEVSGFLPLSIARVSDRLGNVIFQFPVRSIRIEANYLKDKDGVQLSFQFLSQNNRARSLLCIVRDKDDEAIYATRVTQIEVNPDMEDFSVEIELNIAHELEVVVYDMTNQLYLYNKTLCRMENAYFHIDMISNQNRVFYEDGKLIEIGVSSPEEFQLEHRREKRCKDWTSERKYEKERKALESDRSFVQYFQNSHKKAIEDVRALLKAYGRKGVYLWDPYLSGEDIKEILYHVPYAYVPMRAITELRNTEGGNKDTQIKMIKEQLDQDDKKYLLLNLEVRAKTNQHGWKFHDRFLIFPLEKPRVWSLGASVNQLGEKHHILQEVKNAQHILDAFEKLWEQLAYEECMVWKSC